MGISPILDMPLHLSLSSKSIPTDIPTDKKVGISTGRKPETDETDETDETLTTQPIPPPPDSPPPVIDENTNEYEFTSRYGRGTGRTLSVQELTEQRKQWKNNHPTESWEFDIERYKKIPGWKP